MHDTEVGAGKIQLVGQRYDGFAFIDAHAVSYTHLMRVFKAGRVFFQKSEYLVRLAQSLQFGAG